MCKESRPPSPGINSPTAEREARSSVWGGLKCPRAIVLSHPGAGHISCDHIRQEASWTTSSQARISFILHATAVRGVIHLPLFSVQASNRRGREMPCNNGNLGKRWFEQVYMHWITLDRRNKIYLPRVIKLAGAYLKSKIMRINPALPSAFLYTLHPPLTHSLSPCFMQEIVVIINEVVSEGDDY